MTIPIGLKGRAEDLVTAANTAASASSGALAVYSTPSMCALMENASSRSIAPYLKEGESTVGTKLNISHLSASPIGMKIWAESEVTKVDGRRIELNIRAYDDKGLIGEGTHERFIIDDEKFLRKTMRKLES